MIRLLNSLTTPLGEMGPFGMDSQSHAAISLGRSSVSLTWRRYAYAMRKRDTFHAQCPQPMDKTQLARSSTS